MTLADVIAALTARLGAPDRVGVCHGFECASWGITSAFGPSVDVFHHALGAVRVDIYNERQPCLIIAECPREEHHFARECATVADVDAYERSWPVVVPLNVAVELAARTMGRRHA